MTADMKAPRFVLSDDRRSLHMLAGDPPFIWEMNAAVVDDLIEKLCFARRAMLPEIPATWPEGRREPITVQRDPAFTLDSASLTHDPILHIKHPHFGWLHLTFTKPKARELGTELIARADLELPSTAGNA